MLAVVGGGLKLSTSIVTGGGLECSALFSLVGSEVAAVVLEGYVAGRAFRALVSWEAGWVAFRRARG